MTHWAYPLIGKPYRALAAGPDEFDCLGLMEYVFLKYMNVRLPVTEIRLNEAGNEYAIKHAARMAGLRPVFNESQEVNDLVLMEGALGPHIGMLIQVNSRLRLLHSLEGIGVTHCAVADLPMMGFKNMRSWRMR